MQTDLPRSGRLRVRAAYGRPRALILANPLFSAVLAAGAVLRLVAVLGYPGALWFSGDSYVYLGSALRLKPDLSKTIGYSLFLKALEPFRSLTLVTIVQHLMGLAVAVMIYALLRRYRVRKPWASIATLPVLFNGFEVQLEHMVMADALFLFLLMAATTLLLYPERPSWPAVLAAGLLTGYAVTVWTGGLVMPVVFFGYLIVRWRGWRALVAIVAGSAAPVAGYALWFHSATGNLNLSRSGGFYLWGRVSSFAQCSAINPPADERVLCLSQPPSKREPPGDLIWHERKVTKALPGGPVSETSDKLMTNFAIRAVEAQPLSYAHAILDGLVLAIEPYHHPYPSKGTLYDYYFHTRPITVPYHTWIRGGSARHDIVAYGHQGLSRVVKPFATLMSAYQRVFWLYGPLFGLIMVLGLGGIVRITRRPGRGFRLHRRRDGLPMLPWVSAVVLLVVPIAIADFDYRYLLPVVPFACLAAGLAFAPPGGRRAPADPQPTGAAAVPAAGGSVPGERVGADDQAGTGGLAATEGDRRVGAENDGRVGADRAGNRPA